MYMGEHTNVTEKLHDIQKQGRTKGSLLDHIAIPVTASILLIIKTVYIPKQDAAV